MVPDISRPLVSYRGEDAGEMFVRKLQGEAEQLIQEYIDIPQQLLELIDAELRSFHTATNCHICNKQLGGDKVRGHCHIAGNYRGAAYSRYNLAYRISKSEWKLLVVMHNLKIYDGHLIVKALKSEFGEARVTPQNMEKYLSITVDRLKFIIRKGIYPYDYIDSYARFDESRLPSQDAFFSKLSEIRVRTRSMHTQLKEVNGRLPRYLLEVRCPTPCRLLREVSCILLSTLQS